MCPRGDIFLRRYFVNEVKPHLSYEGQINKLREKGCIIDDDSFCRDVLVNIGYYRLSAYFLPFKSFDGTYIDNLSLKKIYRVYEFDRKLRNLLFSAIEVIEVSLRTRLAHFHSEKYGALGYLICWMRCCTDLRNICAHYGRLYFKIFSAMPSGFQISEAAKRRLWGALLSVKALYPSAEKWNSEFMPRIEALF